MKNNYTWYIAVVVAFIAGYLFGQQDAPQANAPADDTAMEQSVMEEGGEAMEKGDHMEGGESMSKENPNDPTDFVLSGYALEDGGVHLEWVLPDNRREPEHFMLVRGSEENPEHDGSHYWFRQHGTKRETNWKDVPAGEQHFRACVLEEKKCVEYTNNVTIEVKKAD